MNLFFHARQIWAIKRFSLEQTEESFKNHFRNSPVYSCMGNRIQDNIRGNLLKVQSYFPFLKFLDFGNMISPYFFLIVITRKAMGTLARPIG
jgi:hypothetical protein